MKIEDLIDKFDERYKRVRMTHYLVNSDKFKKVYLKLNEEEQTNVVQLVEGCQARDIVSYIKCLKAKALEEMSIRELKKLGRDRFVLNYSRLEHHELLQELSGFKIKPKEIKLPKIKRTKIKLRIENEKDRKDRGNKKNEQDTSRAFESNKN